jgi:glycosyltransferase involved in cell wall biosynthesis
MIDGSIPDPAVSVVVPTYNRRASLRRLLASLDQQTLDPKSFEVVIVDNNSSDGTRDTVRDFARGRYVNEPAQGAAHARNRGIRETSSPLIAFIDDDVEADSAWLEEIVRGFADSSAAAVGGRTEPVWETPRPEWWLPEYDKVFARNWGDTPRPVTEFPFFYSLNFAVRRETLVAVGDFDPRLGPKAGEHVVGEDADLCRRIHQSGRMLRYLPRAVVRHHVSEDRLSPAFLRRRFYYSGMTHARQRRIEGRPLEILYQAQQLAIGVARWAVCRSRVQRFRRELEVWHRAGFLRVWIGTRS